MSANELSPSRAMPAYNQNKFYALFKSNALQIERELNLKARVQIIMRHRKICKAKVNIIFSHRRMKHFESEFLVNITADKQPER